LDIKIPKRLKPLFEDKDRHQVIVAHRRFAKTLYSVHKTIFGSPTHSGALTIKDGEFWIVLPTYRQAKLVAWKMLKNVAEQTSKVTSANETELSIKFSTNSIVRLLGSDNPDSLRGSGLDGLCLDEWALQRKEVYTEILRSALADKKGWTVKTFTPKGMNHAYDDFVASGKKHFYPADTSGVIPQEELVEIQKELSMDEYAQEWLCQFLYYAGQIYTEFDEMRHVKDVTDIPATWQRVIGIDYGLRNPTAILFGVIDYDSNLWITDEIYENGREVTYFTELIKAKMGNDEYVAYIDPSTSAHDHFRDGVQYSIFREFSDGGVPVQLANNQVIGGINKVKQMMIAGQLFISPKCINLLREIKTYRWKDKTADDANEPEQPVKCADHAADALRYMIATYFDASVRPEPKKSNEFEMIFGDDNVESVEYDSYTGY
jgi:hypothetical protein